MVKVKKLYKKNYTVIDNTILQDTSISFKAKGIFAYLWMQSDTWNFYEKEVVKHSADGISSLRAGLKELESHGYLLRQRNRVKGKLKDSMWFLSESPNLDFLKQEKLNLEKPSLENQTLTITNLNKYQHEQVNICNKSSSSKSSSEDKKDKTKNPGFEEEDKATKSNPLTDPKRERVYKQLFQIARMNDQWKGTRTIPTPDQVRQLRMLLYQCDYLSLDAILQIFDEKMKADQLFEPWKYVLKLMRDKVAAQRNFESWGKR